VGIRTRRRVGAVALAGAVLLAGVVALVGAAAAPVGAAAVPGEPAIAGLPEISISITGGETPMQLPNPPWYRRWSVILAGVIGLAAITALLGWRGLQDVDPRVTTTTISSSTTTTMPPTSLRQPQTTTTLPTRDDDVLWSKTGSDVVTSPLINAPSVWHIEWKFDCSNFAHFEGGNFKITGDGDFERVDIQAVNIKDSGRQRFTRGGYGHLTVASVCDHWTVKVLRG
jgi:hypothetical protein